MQWRIQSQSSIMFNKGVNRPGLWLLSSFNQILPRVLSKVDMAKV